MSGQRFPCVYEVVVDEESFGFTAKRWFSLPFAPFEGLSLLGITSPRNMLNVAYIYWDVFKEEFLLSDDDAPYWAQKGRGARLPLMPKEDHFAKFSRKRAR
jgi:hypothetical protein